MYYIFYPTKDATISEKRPSMNTGLDPGLSLDKTFYISESVQTQRVSRILIQYGIDLIESLISSSVISASAEYTLQLFPNKTYNLPGTLRIDVHPTALVSASQIISESWDMGLGKTQYYSDSTTVTQGVSWFNQAARSAQAWPTSSFPINTTGSWYVTPGGGCWYTNLIATQSFEYTFTGLSLPVTNIVNSWLNHSIPNNGFIIKYSRDNETDNYMSHVSFFSRDSNTIYSPQLIASWDDSVFVTGSNSLFVPTGSLSPLDLKIWCKNKNLYVRGTDNYLIKLGARMKFPERTFNTASAYTSEFSLPSTSFYSIIDEQTGDVIIPFSNHSKISSNTDHGVHFRLSTKWMQPLRWYRILIKCTWPSLFIEHIYDEDIIFRTEL